MEVFFSVAPAPGAAEDPPDSSAAIEVPILDPPDSCTLHQCVSTPPGTAAAGQAPIPKTSHDRLR